MQVQLIYSFSRFKVKPGKIHCPQDALFPSKPFSPLVDSVTDDDLHFLAEKLHSTGSGRCMLDWVLDPRKTASCPTQTDHLISRHSLKLKCLSSQDMEGIVRNAGLTDIEVVQIEGLTRGQSENPAWHEMRRGRLTASNFGAVLKAIARRSYPPSLLRRLAHGNN